MNIPIHQQLSPWRYLWLIALIGLPVLGWYGVLDDFSSKDINNSISNAGLIYGTARGINALISLLQGTELNAFVFTLSIGEVLDPVNDLIERFSEVVLLALGSLALQKILLVIVSDTLFNIVLSIVALCTGFSLFLSGHKWMSIWLRGFLVIAFLRFSLGLVVIANGWVDTYFLDEADQQRHLAMEDFRGELRQINTLSEQDEQAAELLKSAREKLHQRELRYGENKRALQSVSNKIQETEADFQREADKAGQLCALSIHTPILSPTCPDSVKKLNEEVDSLRADERTMTANKEIIEDDIEELQAQIACMEKHEVGEKCSFWERLPTIPNADILRQKLDELNAGVSDFAENCINLLVSLLLKTVAIPLLFIYLLLKIMRMNWARI